MLSPFHFRNRRFYRYQVTPFSVNEAGKHEVLEPDEAMTSEWSITIEKV